VQQRREPAPDRGGGVGDGEIDGRINVFVIDSYTKAPIASAAVAVPTSSAPPTATARRVPRRVRRADRRGQDVGYRSVVWDHVNGANVTIGSPR